MEQLNNNWESGNRRTAAAIRPTADKWVIEQKAWDIWRFRVQAYGGVGGTGL